MRKKIALLGGSFDPIHIGHLQLALEVKEHFALDEVLFCPAYVSPFKSKEGKVDPSHRLEMVKLAIEPIPAFSILDFEIKQEKISYTVDTLRYLKKKYKEDSLFLIVGEDILENFFEWREPEAILEMATILTGSRAPLKNTVTYSKIPESYYKILEKGFCRIHNLEISATYLRERLQKKFYCAHLVPPKVLDYIQQHGLYSLL